MTDPFDLIIQTSDKRIYCAALERQTAPALLSYLHSELEWGFCFGLLMGWNTTHIHNLCIPLDFLGIMENLKKAKKTFQRSCQRPHLHCQVWSLKIVFGLFKIFLRSMIPKKSSGMQKNIYVSSISTQP